MPPASSFCHQTEPAFRMAAFDEGGWIRNPVPAGEAPATRRRTVPIPVVITPRPAVPGLVWAYRFDEAGRGQRLADDQPIDLALPGEGFRWLHLNLVDRRACHWLANHPALPPAAREIMTSADHHQRVLVADGMLMAVLHDFRRDLDRSSSRTACLHLVLADRFLPSGRQQPAQAADATRRAIEAGQLAGGPVALLEAIVSGVADAAAEVAAAQIRDLEAIEDAVLGDRRNADPAGSRQFAGAASTCTASSAGCGPCSTGSSASRPAGCRRP